jgi:phage terminase small subunit
MALTPKQEIFVLEYLKDLNATQAAIRAGYSAKTAEVIGYENLRKPQIAAAIDAAQKERAEETKLGMAKRKSEGQKAGPLTDKEEWLCREFVADAGENQTRAYMRVYRCCTYESARTLAARVFADVRIQARIKELREERNKRLEISADRVLAELAKLAFYDPRGFFDPDGRLKPIDELDPDHAAIIAGIETVHKVVGEEKDGVVVLTKIKLPDKNTALEKLGKHLMLWKEPGTKDNPLTGNIAYSFNLHPGK